MFRQENTWSVKKGFFVNKTHKTDTCRTLLLLKHRRSLKVNGLTRYKPVRLLLTFGQSPELSERASPCLVFIYFPQFLSNFGNLRNFFVYFQVPSKLPRLHCVLVRLLRPLILNIVRIVPIFFSVFSCVWLSIINR